jgi:uncharacterized protein YecA (UPF0149 family)
MNCNTGEIYPPELMKELEKLWEKKEEKTGVPDPERAVFIPMEVAPTPVQLNRKPPKVGRNEPCPCGSGKKFKHCHLILNFKLTDKRRI